MTGSHPRHIYFAKKMIENLEIVLHIIVVREPMLLNIDANKKPLVYKHFFERNQAENKHFQVTEKNLPLIENTLYRNADELDGDLSISRINSSKTDLIIVYGTGLLNSYFLESFKFPILNVHGGLSPYYKGAATMFWPFYFLEPNFVGVTLHKIVKQIDAGEILHQSTPKLVSGDGIHDVACKAIITFTSELIEILKTSSINSNTMFSQQKKTGKLFLESDFKDEHLLLIYDVYKNIIVDMYLRGDFQQREPKLINYYRLNNK